MFGLSGCAFRFGNVVGPRQTHGVGFDFVRRLLRTIRRQLCASSATARRASRTSTCSDVVGAVLLAARRRAEPFAAYNVATGDYITVTRDRRAGRRVRGARRRHACDFDYTGGDRGWKGDVPVVRLDSDRIRALGWGIRERLGRSTAAAICSRSLADAEAAGLIG